MLPFPRFILTRKKAHARSSLGEAVEESCLLTQWRNVNVNANDALRQNRPPMSRPLTTPWFVCTLVVLLGCSEQDCVAPRWQGIRYDVVEMGGQCWFAENLNVQAYRNGDAIQYAEDNDSWRGATQGMRCQYDHDVAMSAAYGQLYNGHAVLDARGLCPTGWRVPTDGDWENLVAHVSEESATEVEMEGWDGMAHWEVGEFLKDSCCWLPSRLLALDEFKPTNDHGFNALPSGERSFSGFFLDAGEYGAAKWWSSDLVENELRWRSVNSLDSGLHDAQAMKTRGFAIRCVKDGAE